MKGQTGRTNKTFEDNQCSELVHKTTGMLGLQHGQSVLICEKCRQKICTIDGMLDSIKELHFYCFGSWQYICIFFKLLQIKFKGSTTNYDPDACWYITTSSITSLQVLLLIVVSWEHFQTFINLMPLCKYCFSRICSL